MGGYFKGVSGIYGGSSRPTSVAPFLGETTIDWDRSEMADSFLGIMRGVDESVLSGGHNFKDAVAEASAALEALGFRSANPEQSLDEQLGAASSQAPDGPGEASHRS